MNRTISATIDVGEVDEPLSRDHALMFVHAYIEEKIPSNYEFEFQFLDFGIQDGIDGMTQVMFSADVQIWSDSERRGAGQS
jgi:hypothetical protein